MSWYILTLERKVAMNRNKYHVKQNPYGNEYILPFKLELSKEANAQIFIDAVERITPQMQSFLWNEYANPNKELNIGDHADWTIRNMLRQIQTYQLCFRYAFEKVQTGERNTKTLFACYDGVCDLLKQLRDVLEHKERLQYAHEVANLRKHFPPEPMVRELQYETHVSALKDKIHSYEQMEGSDPCDKFLEWKVEQIRRIDAWERAKKKESEEHCQKVIAKQTQKIEQIQKEIQFFTDIQKEEAKHIEMDATFKREDVLAITIPSVVNPFYCSCCSYTARDKFNLDKHNASKKHLKNLSK